MDLLQRIKTDRMKARKERDTLRATLLTTLVGEAETALKGKQAKKFDMLKLVQKFHSNLEESLAIKDTEEGQEELGILDEYIPLQLTEADIKGIILLHSDLTTPGSFFGYMNKTYKGQFDGKLAGELFKELTT